MATTLNQGEIAIIQYSADGNPALSLTGDSFTFVLLADVDASTVIHFTDAGFNAAGQIINDTIVHEGTTTWTSGQALSAGTVVRIFDNVAGDASNGFNTASIGTLSFTGAINGFSTSGDQVFVYQGAVAATGQSPSLLFGASFGDDAAANPLLANGWNTNAAAFNGIAFDNSESQLPTSLIGFEVGFTPEVDNAFYDTSKPGAIQNGTPASVLAAILDENNWTASNSYQGNPPTTYNFSVSAPSNPPTLDTNSGSALNEGATDVVTTAELETNDTDTADTSLVYTLDTTTTNGTLYVDNDGSNTLTGGDTVLGVAGTFTQQNIANSDLQYVHDGGETTSDNFQFDVSDGPNLINNQIFNFTINAVNDVPVITGFDGDTAAYNEAFGGPVPIETGSNVAISDADHTDFNGGSLTVSLTGALAEDQLSINNNGATGIGVSANGVFFNSVQFGTFAGGTNGADLIVTFTTAGATTAVLEELIEALRYDNSDADNPTPGNRSINVVLNDGAGNSATSTAIVGVTAVDDPAVAIDDGFATNETAVLSGQNVFSANPTTPDSDPDSALTVTQVNGNGASVGVQIGLGSGALLTVNIDGTFSYDPNGQFEETPAGSTATDSFTYQLNGDDTATVNITINGVDNNDVFTGTAVVADVINAGIGNDTIDGLSGDDTLNGEAGDDVIQGGNGSDTIDGGIDNDTLYGADGDDIINGGDGDDLLRGNDNRDTLTGGRGADDLRGGAHNDTLNGGTGNDLLFGDADNDILNGNRGNDKLYGGDGDDTLNGLRNNDVLRGQAGDDNLDGGDGNDFLFGGAGRDTITGGVGVDTFVFEAGSEIDIVLDFENGTDLIDLRTRGFADFNADVLANAVQNGSQVDITFGADVLTIRSFTLADFDVSDVLL